MKTRFKWARNFLLVLAGALILGLSEAVYFYTVKLQSNIKLHGHIKKRNAIHCDTLKAIDKLKFWVNELANNDSLSHGTFGFCLATADSGKIILEKNSDVSLPPASALKVVTTGIAMKVAGANYSFPTTLQYSGTIDPIKHLLKGNIYIKGSGDPTLGSDNFGGNTFDITLKRWFKAIHSLGIDSIKGSVIGDGEIFDYDAVPGGWAWEDVEMDYGAPPSGLSFRDNLYDINVNIGQYEVYSKISPQVPELNTTSAILYNPAIYNSYAFAAGPPFTNVRMLRGEVKYSGTYCAPLPDPAYFCSYSLYKYLTNNGIRVSDSATTIRRLRINGNKKSPARNNIMITYSPSLASIVYYTNHVSQNMYAESLLKLISVIDNNYGSTLGGINSIYKFCKNKKMDMRGFYICDGCGLSRANNITARQLTNFLVYYAADSTFFKSFYNSLPIYGEPLIIGEKPAPIAKLNIHGKGGYMSRVRSYCGYVKDKKGKLLAFSMLVNNHEFVWFTLMSRIERLLKIMTKLD